MSSHLDVDNVRYFLCSHCETIITYAELPEEPSSWKDNSSRQQWFKDVHVLHNQVIDDLKEQGYFKKFYTEYEREHRPLLCKDCMLKFRHMAEEIPINGYAMSSCGCIVQRVKPSPGDPNYPWFISIEPNLSCAKVEGKWHINRNDEEVFDGIEVRVHDQLSNRRLWSFDYDWWLLPDYSRLEAEELPEYFCSTYFWLFRETKYSPQHSMDGVKGNFIPFRGHDKLQLIAKRDGGKAVPCPINYVNLKNRLAIYHWGMWEKQIRELLLNNGLVIDYTP